MDTTSIWQMLAEIKIGTLVAWCIVIIAIITALVKGIKSLFVFFARYKKLKDENEHQSVLLKEHDKTLSDIRVCLEKINDRLDEQSEVNLKQIRHTIIHTCYDAIGNNEIQIGKLKSLEEMFEEYTNVFHGNGYVKNLVERVRKLPIVGSIDEC